MFFFVSEASAIDRLRLPQDIVNITSENLEAEFESSANTAENFAMLNKLETTINYHFRQTRRNNPPISDLLREIQLTYNRSKVPLIEHPNFTRCCNPSTLENQVSVL